MCEILIYLFVWAVSHQNLPNPTDMNFHSEYIKKVRLHGYKFHKSTVKEILLALNETTDTLLPKMG